MILTCPACGTQYVVKDGAIPPGGRQVRCASCRHSWHQNPEDMGEAAAGDAIVDMPAEKGALGADPAMENGAAGSVSAEPEEVGPELVASADSPALDGPDDVGDRIDLEERQIAPAAVSPDDEFTPYAVGAADEPERRNPAVAILVAIILVVLAALAFWYFAPAEWKARVGLAEAAETPLQLMMTHSDRQRLASGNELLAISGRVINPTQEAQDVPPITAQLRDDKGKLVYSWTIAPPAPSLKAGDSASFYSAEVNVPAGGDELTVTLGAPKA